MTRWLVICLFLACLFTASAEQTYTVRWGDTLYGIARNHGVTPARLAERNGLSKNYYVRAGQRLIIPDKTEATRPVTKAAPKLSLPATVQQAIDKVQVKPGRWKYIVIHHSAVDTGTVKGMDRYHREVRHMENGLAYHFVIGNGSGMGDGEIGIGSRWTKQLDGGHVTSERQNQISLGICLVGNFDRHAPTPKQLDRLETLVRALMRRCGLPPEAVKTHQQINILYTRCPGRHFPTESFARRLRAPPR